MIAVIGLSGPTQVVVIVIGSVCEAHRVYLWQISVVAVSLMVLCTVVYEGWCQLRSFVILVFVSCLGKRCPSVSACTVMAISHVVVIIFMWLQNTNNK